MAPTDNSDIARTEDRRPLRHIRSFVRREGRFTDRQKAAIDMLLPQWGRHVADGPIALSDWFGNDHPTWLEIGFGMGQSLVQQASAHPEINFLGIEVHRPGVGACLTAAQTAKVTNLRVYEEDAIEVLNRCLADGVFKRVQLFFPDPWPKARHHKRRIVQTEFAQLMRRKLKIGGIFHMATDWENYAEHMRDVMNVAEGYQNESATGDYVPRPTSRPLTKFEARGHRLGHGVWDLMYRRIS
ncbi:tRNA (guanosine(46)-N7)-methyltransferase TrmB [Permianibacter sp. IMCC34836]|uniref:tRNA (guanosine(46)-N7)-methyltransferase TrmB n=1 Tax=Permianibacter fluminis TaxID=2738515 RepID=UPI0015537776|nr:tRNA (guanosine(46)-N7)-methyltransferase TrmB [Permianibacter fluminis]NQD35740.1 tRNA (guanosine(46)-N7)-methyltransferase TrmB [Permianibacter fluminis]